MLSSTVKSNQKLIIRFLEYELAKKGLTERRRMKYILVIKIVLNQINKPLSKLNQKDAEKFFFWIKDSGYSDDTKKTYWVIFRIVAEWVNPKIDVRNFRLKVKLKTKLPEDVLSEEEASGLIAACQSVRDKALVSLTYHAALRSGEVRSLKVKDLVFDQYGAVVMVPEEGKTGSRRIRIIEPVPLLAQYMQDHRFREDPEAPLFYRMDKKTKTFLNYTSLNNIIKSAAGRAGIRKRVYTHILRHSKATELAKKLTSQELMIYGGWKQLKTVQVYTHLSGADIDKKILEINNIKTDIDKYNSVILKTVSCFRCGFQNDSSSKFCSRCGVSLERKEIFSVTDNMEFQQFLYGLFLRWKANRV
ncbi:MAG: tyrosine-type recombinase/integrase [Candidatus Aenigmarchaeota archaeon]|nr:tyrosine-type recombinase/integrase [Candidatus Aenigmarchaeota archaeon]